MEKSLTEPWRPDLAQPSMFRPPETPCESMEFLSRSWSISALEVSKTLSPAQMSLYKTSDGGFSSSTNTNGLGSGGGAILEDVVDEMGEGATVSGNAISFAASHTSQMVMERIMSQSQAASPRTLGRLSHSSGPINGTNSCGSDSPPVSPLEIDDVKFCRSTNPVNAQFRNAAVAGTSAVVGGGKTVGRWLKERREKKKEETRAQNAQVHAAVSVAGLAAAIAAATAASCGSRKDEQMAKTDMAVASAATLVAAQCVEAAEAMGAERDHLASVVSSAVNVKSAGDIKTLAAAAATALRGAATLKARALKDVWNIATVIPIENGFGVGVSVSNSNSSNSGDLVPEENFLGICSRELLVRGCELLKRTRKGDLHWKIVSVYLNGMNQVMLKMKSRHVAGTITKRKKNVLIEVIKDMPAWPGRHLLEGGETRRYFGLKTIMRGVVEFECRNQKEHDIWIQGVSRLLSMAADRSHRHKSVNWIHY